MKRVVLTSCLAVNSTQRADGWAARADTCHIGGRHVTYFLAGDASYNERLMLAGKIDGVSGEDEMAGRTLAAIRSFARDCPTVYLPTHDPESAVRLASRRVSAAASDNPITQRLHESGHQSR